MIEQFATVPRWLGDDRDLLRESIDRYVEKELTDDVVRQYDLSHTPPLDKFRDLAERGWASVTIPEEHGGSGGDYIDLTIVFERLARGMLPLAILVFRAAIHGGSALLNYGQPHHRDQILPAAASGEKIICFGLTEAEAGSDAASIRTTAKPDGDGFVINGSKMFTSAFLISDYVLLAARTGTPESRQKGISVFLIPTDDPGFTATPIETVGHWPVSTTSLFIDDVRVDSSALLGEVNGGWDILTNHLAVERLTAAACSTGAAIAAFEDALEYANTRVQFGRPISKFQVIGHRLADMFVKISTARQMIYDLAFDVTRTGSAHADVVKAAAVKLHCTEVYKEVADQALQIHGGYGYTIESTAARHFRDSRLMTIGGGTSDIQRNIIAKSLRTTTST